MNKELGQGNITELSDGSTGCSARYTINDELYYDFELIQPIQKDEYGIWIVLWYSSNKA